MSRSFKKPYHTDQANKFVKRLASRAVRNLDENEAPQNGKSYRKEFCSYDIRDWSFHAPNDKKAYRK